MHNNTLLLLVSKFLERFTYYGSRSLIFLYIISAFPNWGQETYSEYYAIALVVIGMGSLFGGVLGDLLIQNKRAAWIGAFIEAIGYLVLMIPNEITFFMALILILLGNSLYIPNQLSIFGLSYPNKNHTMDVGFSILYFAVNIGAFSGPLIAGLLMESIGFSFVFALFFAIMSVSGFLVFWTKQVPVPQTDHNHETQNNMLPILLAFIGMGIFWILYEVFGGNFESQSAIQSSQDLNWNQYKNYIMLGIPLILTMFAPLIFTVVKIHPLLKWTLGFVIFALGMGLLLYINDFTSIPFVPASILIWTFIGIAELFIAPIFYSIITRFTPSKYLATFFGIGILIPIVLGRIVTFLPLPISLCIIVSILIGLGSFLIHKNLKKN